MSTSTTKDTGGETIERFSDRLAIYPEPEAVESWRAADMPQFPQPDTDSLMLEQLVHRSEEIAESNGRPTAAIWLAAHAWFEGAVAALASAAQLTDRHPRGPFGLPFPEHRTPVITRRSIRP